MLQLFVLPDMASTHLTDVAYEAKLYLFPWHTQPLTRKSCLWFFLQNRERKAEFLPHHN